MVAASATNPPTMAALARCRTSDEADMLIFLPLLLLELEVVEGGANPAGVGGRRRSSAAMVKSRAIMAAAVVFM